MKDSHHSNCIGYALLLLFTCHVQLRIVCLHGVRTFIMDTCAVSLVQSSSLPARSAVVQGAGCQKQSHPHALISSLSPVSSKVGEMPRE